jgi:tetratricopeptide (TPR) repeat protein
MRATHHVTGMLLVAAFAAVACSKQEAKTKKSDPHASPPAKPAVVQSVAAKQFDDEGFLVGPTPKTAASLPITFVDGEAAFHAGQYTDAKTIFEGYVVTHPKNAFGHYMLGLSAWKANDLSGAERAFNAALAIDSNHVKSLVNLSRVLIEQKRYDDAIGTLTKAGDIDPKSSDVQRLLGRTYHSKRMLADAETAYRLAIDLDDKDAWSMNNLGLVLLEQKRAADALPLLTKAVELKKDVAAFYNNLGMALEQTGQFKAAQAYADAMKTDPFYEKAKQNLARVSVIK